MEHKQTFHLCTWPPRRSLKRVIAWVYNGVKFCTPQAKKNHLRHCTSLVTKDSMSMRRVQGFYYWMCQCRKWSHGWVLVPDKSAIDMRVNDIHKHHKPRIKYAKQYFTIDIKTSNVWVAPLVLARERFDKVRQRRHGYFRSAVRAVFCNVL